MVAVHGRHVALRRHAAAATYATTIFAGISAPPESRFVWTAQVGYQGLIWFRASAGQAGVDPHLQFSNPLAVECLLMRWKPAHTWLVFDYTPLDWSDPMEGTP